MRATAADLVIFDCDGVLVDSEPLAAAALAEELADAGIATTAEDCLDHYTGLSLDSVIAGIEARWARTLPSDFRERLKQRDYDAFRRHLRPIPGVDALLAVQDVTQINRPKQVLRPAGPPPSDCESDHRR